MVPFDAPLWLAMLWLFVLGSVVGSFLNVCIYRMPNHDDLRRQLQAIYGPASHCPRCGHAVGRRDNIPILGWLLRRGRCRHCGARFSGRYALVELGTAVLFAVVYWYEIPAGRFADLSEAPFFRSSRFDPSGFTETQQSLLLHARYACHMVMLCALIVATFIDLDRWIIPDGSTLPAMAVGVIGGWAIGYYPLVPVWFQDPGLMRSLELVMPQAFHPLLDSRALPEWITRFPHLHGLAVSIAGLLVGGGCVWAVRVIGQWVLRQEAMGFGDVVLMAMIGSFIGWQPVVVVFLIAPLCALVSVTLSLVVRRERHIPYGPYLSVGTLILLLGWEFIWPRMERIFEMGPLIPLFAVFMVILLAASLQLVQFTKWVLGIPLYPEEWVERWEPADQLAYLAGENVDDQQGRWRREHWPGAASGRGTAYEDRWRRGSLDGRHRAGHR